MEDPSDAVPTPPPLERQPTTKRPRKKPDLSGVEPKEITIKTKTGEKTFAARSKPKKVAWADAPPPAAPQNPWSSVMNSWLD